MPEKTLATVLAKWEKEGGNLVDMIYDLGDYPIKDRADAQAVCHALTCPRLNQPDSEAASFSPLQALTGLFQNVASAEALTELGTNGLSHLRKLVRERMGKARDQEAESLLFVLKILASYGHAEDVDLIVEAARIPLQPETYMWAIVFERLDDEHPAWRKLYDGLRQPLPEGFLAVAYLDFVNGQARRKSLDDHPFATPEGVARLRTWLSDPDEEHSSYAHSAAAALPFIPEKPRSELLELAGAYPVVTVRMEAAWARAKLGDTQGRQLLRDWCRDVKVSQTACAYLIELGYQDDIPPESLDPDFRATAEMCNWLAHPQEFGRPPDRIDLYDKRMLFWPPTNDTRPVWLFKYTYLPARQGEEREAGIGMVGSVTFALFGETTKDMSPEDVYGLHCCRELEWNEDSRAPAQCTAQAGRRILAGWNRGFK